MKTSTILIIALVGFIAYLMFSPNEEEKKRWDREKEEEMAANAATPIPPPPPQATPPQLILTRMFSSPVPVPRQALVLVRGTVLSVTPQGMVVDCEKQDGWHPVSGTLDNPRNAKDPDEEERRVWGDVIIADHGSAHVSSWVPEEKAVGRFLLKDHPFQLVTPPGAKIKVIAAPVEEIYSNGSIQLRAYTANFTIISTQEKGGKWMWDRSQGTMLDH